MGSAFFNDLVQKNKTHDQNGAKQRERSFWVSLKFPTISRNRSFPVLIQLEISLLTNLNHCPDEVTKSAWLHSDFEVKLLLCRVAEIARHTKCTEIKERNLARWARLMRDWSPLDPMILNPERDSVIAEHAAEKLSQPLAA